jgi:hypothetical protein
MPDPPQDYNICPCCGTEFGNDDIEYSFEQLRYQWIANGARWFFGAPPYRWSAGAQLTTVAFGVHTEVSNRNERPNSTSIGHRQDNLELQYA